MANEAKREEIKKYFKPFPKEAILAIVIGFPLLYVHGLGAIPIFIGFFMIKSWTETSSLSIDNYITEDLSVVKSKSLEKISMNESELVCDSVVVAGPRFWNTSNAVILYKKELDGWLRFTPIDVTVLHMTQHKIVSYQCCLDLTTGNHLDESTEEYLYKDIVSVAIKTESETYTSDKFGTIQLDEAKSFVLTTLEGTPVKTVLSDPKLIDMMGGGEISTTEADCAVHVIAKILKEKSSIILPDKL